VDKYQRRIRSGPPHFDAARRGIVPADHKWFARVADRLTIVSALDRLDLHYPKVNAATAAGIQGKCVRRLENEGKAGAVAKKVV